MGFISTWMGDHFSALLMSLMALQLTLVDQNLLWPCYFRKTNTLFMYLFHHYDVTSF